MRSARDWFKGAQLLFLFLTVPGHLGTRLPLMPSPGRNELILRVDGERFAGGGFFAEIVYPALP